MQVIKFLLFGFFFIYIQCSKLDLHPKHLEYYFNQFPDVLDECKKSNHCPYSSITKSSKCWGYESDCKKENAYSYPECPGKDGGWAKSKEEQFEIFYKQADFGFVKEQRDEMTVMCEPQTLEDSSLECSKHLKFCRGRNIFMNLTGLSGRKTPIRYHMDVLSHGQVGGKCRFHKDKLKAEADHVSPLQSWAPELLQFTEMIMEPIASRVCDVVIEKPIYVMKIDASVNMYHHFCDFFNLYASQHVNSSHPEVFSRDVHILIWESYTYGSSFSDTFKAFTNQPIWDLKTFIGLNVCFRNIVFPLLPRMIYGLYYNTPLIGGCEKSALFDSFSKHILHRLDVSLKKRKNSKVRITILSRNTQFRNILNEQELITALKNEPNVLVKRVVYSREMNFTKQLEKTYNSDVFIGMHGAGLTHIMFLPDWAAAFELYNCEDEHCYKDLARLRGVKYITWQKKDKLIQQDEGHHPEGGAHAKFTNYQFDVEEFLRLVRIGIDHVRNHEKFKQHISMIHDEL